MAVETPLASSVRVPTRFAEDGREITPDVMVRLPILPLVNVCVTGIAASLAYAMRASTDARLAAPLLICREPVA